MSHAEPVEVDPEIAVLLREIEEAGVPSVSSLSVDEARAQVEERNQALNEDPPVLASVSDLEMPGPAGPICLRHYRPVEAATLPVIVYFHGGGFVVGSLNSHDRLMRLLALDSGAALIGVDYRLAPEHPFPAPLDDCVAAVRWIRAHAGNLGVDPERVVLAGDSAGANLALASLLDLRDAGDPACAGAALLYGCYWRRLDTPSHVRFGDGSWRLGTAEMAWFWQHYLGDRSSPDPRGEPIHADLSGLPPLFVTAAALDPLADDTAELGRRLEAAGVAHQLKLYPGVVHGFLQMSQRSTAAREAVRDAGDAIRKMLD
ncbi:MAG: alpha/beta hydrolase [Pseudomonadota bacterium]